MAVMLELQDNAAFKDHLRDFLVQTKSFSSQDNADLFADEAAAAREVCWAARQCAHDQQRTHMQSSAAGSYVSQQTPS